MSLIFGIGAGILVLLVALYQMSLTIPVAAVLTLVVLIVPSVSNYMEHDRSGLLGSMIMLITCYRVVGQMPFYLQNGDNDTFLFGLLKKWLVFVKTCASVNLSLVLQIDIKQMLENESVLKIVNEQRRH